MPLPSQFSCFGEEPRKVKASYRSHVGTEKEMLVLEFMYLDSPHQDLRVFNSFVLQVGSPRNPAIARRLKEVLKQCPVRRDDKREIQAFIKKLLGVT